MEKEFKTIEEQIEILEQKNLIIENKKIATEILENNNYYYLINGYKDLFVDKRSSIETFKHNTNLNEIYSLYKFDSNLRMHFLKYILLIERRIDTYIAYEFSKVYGHKEYLKENNFENTETNKVKIEKLINDINNSIVEQSNNGNKMLLHYLNKYKYIPLWVLIRILTFGQVSKFYRLMKQKEANAVSKKFKVDYKVLRTYLVNLAVIRNVCAHDEKLYDIRLKYKIGDTKYHKQLNLKQFKGNYVSGNKDLFSIIIIFKEILPSKEFNSFYKYIIKDIEKLKNNIVSITIEDVLDKMGFPEDYKDMLSL